MELHLKKRILGAIITVIALVLVLPVILEGPRSYHLLETQAPPAPEAPEWVTTEYRQQVRQDVEDLADGTSTKKLQKPEIPLVESDEAAPNNVPEDRSALDENQLPYSWTLQLGAFGQIDNALRYRDQLRKRGYQAYVNEVNNMSRVYVGPEMTRAAIETLKKKLQLELNQEDIYIRRYIPES